MGISLSLKVINIAIFSNPATGEVIGKVNLSNLDDLKKAIDSSNSSIINWQNTTPLKKISRIMSEFKNLLNKNIDQMANIVSEEHGKTIEDAKGSITRGIEVVEFACGIPQLLKGEFSQNVGTDIDSWSIRQPLGICCGITPSIFQQWFQCGCSLYQLLVEMHSF